MLPWKPLLASLAASSIVGAFATVVLGPTPPAPTHDTYLGRFTVEASALPATRPAEPGQTAFERTAETIDLSAPSGCCTRT
ncbi:hypothetical protein HT136_14185 [Novosphingobium profundi]|uniref:hypothetical protein n=1 Tax=Novosphingobium profundi TaxID=1774954 RepID=UPI001BDA6B80|nr:hypothetical protein [Novosphingobium profundi]MBT0669515.1 hypothetical protein [Novosphingobium profundi]